MPASSWIAHVKSVYSKGNMSYKEAMKRAAKTWKKKKGAAAAPARKSRGRKKAKAEDDDEKSDEKEEPKQRKRKRARPSGGPGKFEKNIN